MKAIRKIWNLITAILVIAVVLLAVALAGVRLVGLTPYAVLSGSMEPTYHVGALIYVKSVPPEQIEVGMPITFVVNEDLVVATHRVVDAERRDTKMQELVDEEGNPVLDEDGNTVYEEVMLEEPSYYFTTKGDANEAADGSLVNYKNVLGTPIFTLPYLGYLSSWLQTKKGMMLGGCIAVVLLMLTFIPDLIRGIDDEPKKKKRGKHSKRKRKAAARVD